MATEIISRKDARAQGLKLYQKDVPCMRGQLSERYVSCAHCVECERETAAKRLIPGAKREARLAARRHRRKTPKARAKEREWVSVNRERTRASAQKSYLKNVAKNRARAKKWREENPEKRQKYLDEGGRQKAKKWRESHRDYGNFKRDLWRQQNRERHLVQAQIYSRRRRAWKADSEGDHTAADLADILRMQKNRCAHPGCGADLRKVGKHLDHIIPLALGGSNDRRNLQFLCPTHNLRKGARDPIDFARQHGRLL